ncbi:dipeptide/oligopeptide/nickel ABC transporter permease/ATP-binding protein [Conexibacter sp. S30A1]|uniref:dipeptide/oligopeptide/nickel ABC transporter permease/ATP-binding protein n=1 Tax=Conexibacter sp. S30A1 TaxID=2937800 RepID=UPI00200D4BE3|nr:dipeptide/oligopeptide/nickel ABC transporter permease/ATP-binding protein [Conexibacter sp. S30A1]
MSVATPAVLENEADAAASVSAVAPKGILRTIVTSKRGASALVYLVLIFLACELAGVLTSGGPNVQNLLAVNQGPSIHHLLGTDELGRDLLTRILYGGRSSLVGIAEALGALLIISIPLGVIAGYVGGLTDRIITRGADLVMSIPVIIILLAVLAIFGHSMTTAMIAFGVLGSAGVTRVVRSAALAARSEAFIDAAKVIGVRRTDIIFRHVLPQCRGVIVVQAALFAAIALGVQTGLTFLSLGPAPPAPTWGGMVADAVSQFYVAPWQLVPSGVVIALTVIAFGVLGDVVRDAIADSHSAGVAGGRHRVRRRPDSPRAGAAPEGALLAATGLSVAVGADSAQTFLIKEVSLHVGFGEALGIVGESGSGKSITMKAIAGLLPAGVAVTEGAVWFEGTELTTGGADAYRSVRGRGVSIVTQEPMRALDPSYRVGRLLADLVRSLDGCTRAQARECAIELLGRVQILDPEDVAQRYPHEISGGMAQRVAIAMALAGKPRLLIADEPTTALDVTVQAEILDLLRRLQQDTGMALILVSHDLGVVSEICDRVCVMYAGEVVEVAQASELFDQPMHPYTRALMSANPGSWQGGQLSTIPGMVPSPQDWPVGCHFAPRCGYATDACVREPIILRQVTATDQARCVRAEVLSAELSRTPTEVRQ